MEGLRAYCFTQIKGPVRESFVSPAAVALSNAPEHELPGKLLGQCADGARVPQLENRMDTDSGLQNGQKTQCDISHFLMHRYNWIRPHQFIGGLAPARTEEKLNVVSGIS